MQDLLLRSLHSQLHEMLREMPHDLERTAGSRFSDEDLLSLCTEAKEKLRAQLLLAPPMTSAELTQAWQTVLADFSKNEFWGRRVTGEPPPDLPERKEARSPKLEGYLRTFLVPTLLNKAFIMYFGLQYSMYPGEGYGYGLAITVSLTLVSFAYFIWLNWEASDRT